MNVRAGHSRIRRALFTTLGILSVALAVIGAFVPGLPQGQRRQQTWPSTVAYLARLVIHRYAMLGVLDEAGFPLREMGVLAAPLAQRNDDGSAPTAPPLQPGRPCPECGNASMIHKDGCDFCTACGYVGQCG